MGRVSGKGRVARVNGMAGVNGMGGWQRVATVIWQGVGGMGRRVIGRLQRVGGHGWAGYG